MLTKLRTKLTFSARLAVLVGCLSVLLLPGIQPALAAAPTNAGAKVSFTFDDGLASTDSLAGPTLKKYGYTGTEYVITNCVGMTTVPNTCPASSTNAYMTWNQVTDLHSTYGWEIGSHTLNHPLTAAADNKTLTDAQLDAEMSGSQQALASHGFNATDFASPYGDYDNRSIAAASKYYDSHRAFQDFVQPPASELANAFPYYSPRNKYPYNDKLLTVMQVQGNVPVATVKSYVDAAKANNQWLILVFHEIKASGASTAEADYQYNNADLDAIAAYVKAQNVPVTDVAHGLATGNNLMANSGFNNGVADGWTTDNAAAFKADKQTTSLAGHGSYDGTASGPLNSIAITGAAADTHLFSPKVAVNSANTYTLKNFVNLTSTSGEIDFFVDEYDAAGNYLSGKYVQGVTGSTDANAVQAGQVNFTYTPSSASVVSADLQVIAHGAGTRGYLDNCQWLAPDGAVVTPPPVDTTPPVISSVTATSTSTTASVNWTTNEASTSQVQYGLTTAYGSTSTLSSSLVTAHSVGLTSLVANTTYHYRVTSTDAAGNTATSADASFTTPAVVTAKAGDVNGDGTIDALDLSTVLADWNKTGQTRVQGDLNGDGTVDALDLSLILSNWSK